VACSNRRFVQVRGRLLERAGGDAGSDSVIAMLARPTNRESHRGVGATLAGALLLIMDFIATQNRGRAPGFQVRLSVV